jgi:predicted DNA-binding ribbon-helix-helix protein
MRTTVDIEATILKDLKKIQQQEGQSLGRLISNLLAQALRERKLAAGSAKPQRWIAKPMGARINLADREALVTVY